MAFSSLHSNLDGLRSAAKRPARAQLESLGDLAARVLLVHTWGLAPTFNRRSGFWCTATHALVTLYSKGSHVKAARDEPHLAARLRLSPTPSAPPKLATDYHPPRTRKTSEGCTQNELSYFGGVMP
eukprot:4981053-Amphidinium_carterae.1